MAIFNTELNYRGNFGKISDFPENGRSGDILTYDGHKLVWTDIDNAWQDCGRYDVPAYEIEHAPAINEDRIMEKVKALLEKQKPVFVKMTCHNCGAGVYQKAEDHIFKCKFCRTTYFVGTEMTRDRGY